MTREQEKRGARSVDLHVVREIIDGPGDPRFRFDIARITAYSLGCALMEYANLNDDKFRTIQAYCKAADEDKAEIARLKKTLETLDPAPLVNHLKAEIAEAMEAVNACLQWSNGRETEWGGRAVEAIGFLHALCMRRQERRAKYSGAI